MCIQKTQFFSAILGTNKGVEGMLDRATGPSCFKNSLKNNLTEV